MDIDYYVTVFIIVLGLKFFSILVLNKKTLLTQYGINGITQEYRTQFQWHTSKRDTANTWLEIEIKGSECTHRPWYLQPVSPEHSPKHAHIYIHKQAPSYEPRASS